MAQQNSKKKTKNQIQWKSSPYKRTKEEAAVFTVLLLSASLFLEFLARNNILYKADQKRVSDGALVAITLMIAESDPKEKDIMVNLVMNLLIM